MLVVMALAGYAAVALWTAHYVFARQRAAFLARRAEGRSDAAVERQFRRQEREQAKAIALLVGCSWPVSGPALLARRLVAVAVLNAAGPAARRDEAADLQRRIRQLERDLGLDAGPDAGLGVALDAGLGVALDAGLGVALDAGLDRPGVRQDADAA
ncbi:hypothetical protein [Streptacidiphilus neutrinimicus]|uniref:hypothetical protein n=1 Tax=Streptacidiphilus neutrinimicus TaxID=105420 RepID=UPI0005A67A94|nr:hypothetical protein [Streptacidiphilus neutrinimicus]